MLSPPAGLNQCFGWNLCLSSGLQYIFRHNRKKIMFEKTIWSWEVGATEITHERYHPGKLWCSCQSTVLLMYSFGLLQIIFCLWHVHSGKCAVAGSGECIRRWKYCVSQLSIISPYSDSRLLLPTPLLYPLPLWNALEACNRTQLFQAFLPHSPFPQYRCGCSMSV